MNNGIIVASLVVASLGLGVITTGCTTSSSCKKGVTRMESSEFYKDGKFDQAKAKQAYFDLMTYFNVPIYPALKKDDGFFWAVDFNKGDFMKYGMAGVFWANEEKEGYFGHEIYLLPGQSIPEHKHLPTQNKEGKVIRCKMESWQVRHGYVYGFSEMGEDNLDQFPEAKAMLSKVQAPYLKSRHVQKWEADGKVHKLAKDETWHFMMAGPEGAIVTEYATFHDGAGLRFSVPGVSL